MWTSECLNNHPVSIGVDNEVGGGRPVEKEPIVDHALEVAEEPLESGEMWLPGIMHVETDLLNSVGIYNDGKLVYSSNPRWVGIYRSYTWASRWASIHMGSIYSNSPKTGL